MKALALISSASASVRFQAWLSFFTAWAAAHTCIHAQGISWDAMRFQPDPVVTLYLENPQDGNDIKGRIVLHENDAARGDIISLQVYNSEERAVLRHYHDSATNRGMVTTLGDREIDEGVNQANANPAAGNHTQKTGQNTVFEETLQMNGPGITQIRLVSAFNNTTLLLEGFPETAYGVSFQNGIYSAWRPGLREAWFHVPRNAMNLRISGHGITIYDEKGKQVYPADPQANTSGITVIPIERRGVTWRMTFSGNWSFRASGFALILTDDHAFADRLGAALRETEDGTYVRHRFQEELLPWISWMLQPERVGDTTELLALMDTPPDSFTADDVRLYQSLQGPYGLYPHLRIALEEQLLDPQNHWAGTIGRRVWEERLKADCPESRWDFLEHAPGRRGQNHGGISDNSYAVALAQAYHLDAPFNQLYHNKALLYRSAAAALRDLMAITEADYIAGSGADDTSYSGLPAFVFAKRYFEEYSLVAPHMPDEVYQLWTEALRRLLDRYWAEGLVSTRNQSAHFLKAFALLAQGSQDPQVLALAQAYASRFIAGMSPAGYPPEAMGVCGTYAGISHWYMSLYYHIINDEDMLEAIRQSYYFYNHTAAPEPGGRAYAGFNFSSRVTEGFHAEQYGGARPFLASMLPEVALWRNVSSTKPDHLSWPEPQNQTPRWPQLAWERYYFRKAEDPLTSGTWPAMEEESFTRVIGDELVAVKRPGYYASFYVGKPINHPFYLFGTDKGIKPLPNNADFTNQGLYASIGRNRGYHRPMNNGGFTLLWTPDFGNAIIGGPTARTHHGLIAETPNGKLQVEDYFQAAFVVDELNETMTCRGKVNALPLTYKRRYTFHDNAIEVDLELVATAAFQVDSLVENIPLAGGVFKTNGAVITMDTEEHPWSPATLPQETADRAALTFAISDSLALTDNYGETGILLLLNEPHTLRLCRSGPTSSGGIQHNRVEIELPSSWKRDQAYRLHYIIQPLGNEG